MSFLDKGFMNWIRKHGSKEDKKALQGSGLPTPESREQSKRAYTNYLKYLKQNNNESINSV